MRRVRALASSSSCGLRGRSNEEEVKRGGGQRRGTHGLGAGHGFKFAALFGRLLTDMAIDGASSYDLSAFRLDRAALTDPSYVANWMV